jgi:prepilin-type N-terminal cleavage/methylation domain-containing protein
MRRVHPCPTDDDGVTLAEVLVGLGVLSVVMSIATGGILQVFRAIARADAESITQSQVQLAFATLDKEVRYASWVRPPADIGRYVYVEFLGAVAQTRVSRCHRVVIDRVAGTLRLQSWRPDLAPTAGRIVAEQLVTSAGLPVPFTLIEPDTQNDQVTSTHHRLRIRVTIRFGSGSDQRTVSSDVTFTALNTKSTSAVGPECTGGRPT